MAGCAPACACSTLIAEPRPRFAVHGSGGSFVKFGIDVQEAQLKSGMDPRDPRFGIDERDGTFTAADGNAQFRSDRAWPLPRISTTQSHQRSSTAAPVPVDPADSRDGLMLIDLARRSSALGQRLPVPGASSPEA